MIKRLGMYGGSFNPVHNGHLIMARDALEMAGLDKVLFIPAAAPPHKLTHEIVDGMHRLEMLKLAVQDDDRFMVSDEELARGGISYTIDTVRRIHERYPDTELSLIIGGDTLTELHTWKDINRLLDLCEIITMARPGYEGERLRTADLHLPPARQDQLRRQVFHGHLIDISASDIRVRIAQGHGIRYLVPDAVEAYIRRHRLYQ